MAAGPHTSSGLQQHRLSGGAGEQAAASSEVDDGALVGFVEVSERPWGEGCETAPVGWIESILVAAKDTERIDDFFTNVVVTQEEYVQNLTSAVERTAQELAGERSGDEASQLEHPDVV